MRRQVVQAVLGTALTVLAGTSAPDAANTRTTVVVSDLHMGAGRDSTGAWLPSEDFRWPAEFGAFLESIGRSGATDLILNGDTFELLRSATSPCSYADESLGCSEPDALERLNRVLAAHRTEIEAIGRFARQGTNHVVFVPGDQDASLVFQSVARRLVAAVGAPSGRVDVVAAGYWRSADGRVYAEHGHQIGYSAHRFEGWPKPFVRRDGREHVGRPSGERLVGPLYDRLESRYPAIDNLAVLGAGLRYVLPSEGPAGTGETIPELLRYLLFATPWQQFRMELDDGEVEPPVWDVAAVRAQKAAFVVSAFPDDDPFKPVAVKAQSEGRVDRLAEELTDEEIVTLCDYRAAVRRSRRRNEPVLSQLSGRGPVIPECPRAPETRGARFEYFWRSRDRIFQRHLDALPRATPSDAPPSVMVWGHTHLPDRSQSGANMISGGLLKIPLEGFSPVRGALTPLVINGGAWQRTITPVQIDRLKTERNVSYDALLAALGPEDLAACYSFVLVPPYEDQPAPAVRYWRSDGAEWSMGPSCGR